MENQQKFDIERIKKMENAMNSAARAARILSDALDLWENAQSEIETLSRYFGSESWKIDRDADERALVPADIPHGVLSEDGAYNVLCDCDEIKNRLCKIARDLICAESGNILKKTDK